MKAAHPCNHLGLCQNKTPRCNGCSAAPKTQYAFAPGVIEGGPKKRQARALRRALLRCTGVLAAAAATVVVALAASAALAGFAAGYWL